ncbi:MAG: lipoprotein, partial [Clostridia bacterium]|nr:lipoprotein [Clostridia bacterium]
MKRVLCFFVAVILLTGVL